MSESDDGYGPSTYGDRIADVYDEIYPEIPFSGDISTTVDFLSSLAGAADADPESALVFALGAEPAKFVAVAGIPKVWNWELLNEDLELHGRVTGTIAALREWLSAQAHA